jgi:hypothetical protein
MPEPYGCDPRGPSVNALNPRSVDDRISISGLALTTKSWFSGTIER